MKRKAGIFKTVVILVIGLLAGGMICSYIKNKIIIQERNKIDKFKDYYVVLNRWLQLKIEGKSIENYFLENNYKTIAIYGMGELGSRLYADLKNTSINVKYTIDKSATNTLPDIPACRLIDELPEVDAIVVTATFAYSEIENDLKAHTDYPIISLEDVVSNL